jgi:hypothetical protein
MCRHCDCLIPNLNILTNRGSTDSTSEVEQEEGEILGKKNTKIRIRLAKCSTGKGEC